MRLCISIASILLVTTPAVAAVITVREQTPDRPSVVVVEGSLAAFDEDQFAAKAASLSSAFVAFSSDGGSLLAGLRIGEAIRRKGFSTIVPDGRRCASACALAWLGGVERFIGTSGKISFHAAYDSASGESGVGNAVVDAYLSKIGMPHDIFAPCDTSCGLARIGHARDDVENSIIPRFITASRASRRRPRAAAPA